MAVCGDAAEASANLQPTSKDAKALVSVMNNFFRTVCLLTNITMKTGLTL